jgi:hypothetical protein
VVVHAAGVSDLDALKGLCVELAAEPLWHASLGSKELFHSNLLAWALERTDGGGRRRLLGQPEGAAGGGDRVLRESRHLDLVVELDGQDPVVIENKAFSLPDEAQLERYAADAVGKLPGVPTLVLWSLLNPGWPDGQLVTEGRTWRWLSYPQVAERLEAEFGGRTDFANQVLVHEARLLRLLTAVMDQVAVRDAGEPLALPSAVGAVLRGAQLEQAVSKARAFQVGQLIRERLHADKLREPAWPLEVGFSNGQSLLSGFWRAAQDVWAGWQFQGGQWRLALILREPDLFGRGHRNDRAAFAVREPGFFDFTAVGDVLGVDEQSLRPRKTAKAPEFNAYEPDFVYQYRRLSADTTVGQLVELAARSSRHCARWRPTPDWPQIEAGLARVIEPLLAAGWEQVGDAERDQGNFEFAPSVSRRLRRDQQEIEVEYASDRTMTLFFDPDGGTDDDPAAALTANVWDPTAAADICSRAGVLP